VSKCLIWYFSFLDGEVLTFVTSLCFFFADGVLDCKKIAEVLGDFGNIYDYYLNRSDANVREKLAPVYENRDKGPHNLNNDQLDLLAMICTLVKILYVSGGNFPLIRQLVSIVEPARSGREIHTTTIRNEHAYYCCIAQLLEYHHTNLPAHPPVFIMGDSHTLPLAWQTINVRDQPRLLVPKLVTGCKMWHLRPESYFFPKDNFYNVLDSSMFVFLNDLNFFLLKIAG
jgi:hypothetical protein